MSKEGLRECTKFCRQVILVIVELHCTDMGIVQENANFCGSESDSVVKTIGGWKKGSSNFSSVPNTDETFRGVHTWLLPVLVALFVNTAASC